MKTLKNWFGSRHRRQGDLEDWDSGCSHGMTLNVNYTSYLNVTQTPAQILVVICFRVFAFLKCYVLGFSFG